MQEDIKQATRWCKRGENNFLPSLILLQFVSIPAKLHFTFQGRQKVNNKDQKDWTNTSKLFAAWKMRKMKNKFNFPR